MCVYVHIFTCATVNKTVHKASAPASELASSCMCCHHLVQLGSLHLNAGYSDIIKTVATFFLLFLSCSLCYFYCFLESIFFSFSPFCWFVIFPFTLFFTYISVFLYSISVNFSFLLPTFFHSLFLSLSFLCGHASPSLDLPQSNHDTLHSRSDNAVLLCYCHNNINNSTNT